MVRVSILSLALALPASLSAQDNSSIAESPAAAISMGRPSSAYFTGPMERWGEFPGASAGSQRSPATPAPPSQPEHKSDAPITGTAGYIDNAVVGSEIRTRFDAAFDDNHPDRAEFFYALCSCDDSRARGPHGLVTALNFQQVYLRGEYAPIRRLSFLVDVPLRWIQPQGAFIAGSGGFPNEGGISDVQAGLKFAALASRRQFLTFQLVASLPSGDSTKGLGTAHYSVAPSLLYFQKVTDRFSIEGELGDTHPIGGDIPTAPGPGIPGEVFTYGVGPSYEIYRGEHVRIAPVIELVGWKVLGGKQTSFAPSWAVTSVDGFNTVNLKAGFRTSIGNHTSFYLGFGQALTHEFWYKHILRLEYRRTF
jgi:hypothetical protein